MATPAKAKGFNNWNIGLDCKMFFYKGRLPHNMAVCRIEQVVLEVISQQHVEKNLEEPDVHTVAIKTPWGQQLLLTFLFWWKLSATQTAGFHHIMVVISAVYVLVT